MRTERRVPVASGERGVERHQRIHDRQASADRPFRVILARGGPAEVDEHAVAEVLGDVPVEPSDHLVDHLIVGADDLTHFFGIEARAQLRRADEIAEEHGQLAALADRGGTGAGAGAGAGGAAGCGVAGSLRDAPHLPQNFA